MSRRSLPANDARQDRKRARRADQRRTHTDKYAHQRINPTDRELTTKLADLAARFDGEESPRG